MSLRERLPFVGGDDHVRLEELDDETFDRATDILEANDDELTRKNIETQANHLLELESVDDHEVRLGVVQDDHERERADRDLLAPSSIEEVSNLLESGYMVRNGQYVRILTIHGYPERVPLGWLDELYTTNEAIRVTQHIAPRDPSSVLRKLQKRLNQLRARLQRKAEKNRTDTQQAEADQSKVENLIWDLIAGETKLFDVAVYIEIVADTKEELGDRTKRVLELLAQANAEAVTLDKRQVESQVAMAPVGDEPIRNTQLMQETAAATMFPFIEPAVADPEGVLYGFDQTNTPVLVDRYALSGHCKAICGKIGSGKTYAEKAEQFRRLLIDPDIEMLALDPLGDFVEFAENLDGQVITFGGDNVINPLAIRQAVDDTVEDPFRKKLRSVMGMFQTHFAAGDGLAKEEEGILRRAVRLAYLQYGITEDPSTHSNTNPTIQDILDILDRVADGDRPSEFLEYHPDAEEARVAPVVERIEDRFRGHDADHAYRVLLGLEEFQVGGESDNLNGRTNIELDDRYVVFDMSMFADTGQAPLLMHVMLDWVYQRAQSSDRRTQVAIDEVHYLMRRPAAQHMLNLFVRHSRHFNTGLTVISQTVDEFLTDETATEIFDQCDIKQVFRLENISDDVARYLDLTPAEQSFIAEAQTGENSTYSESLLSVTGHGRKRITIHSGEFEQHVLDDAKDPWRYLERAGVLSAADIEFLAEQGRADEYAVDVSGPGE